MDRVAKVTTQYAVSDTSLHSFQSSTSCKSGNPACKDWIPGHVRNDECRKGIYGVLH